MGHRITESPEFKIQQLSVQDAGLLASFYNRLSQNSKRTFRPIGPITVPDKCVEIAVDNDSARVIAKKYDLIAWYDGEIIGWAFIWDLDSDSPTFGLAVADAFHNQGIGTLLISEILSWAWKQSLVKIHLTVVQDNEVACHLYEKFGFLKTGEFVGDDGLPYFSMVSTLRS